MTMLLPCRYTKNCFSFFCEEQNLIVDHANPNNSRECVHSFHRKIGIGNPVGSLRDGWVEADPHAICATRNVRIGKPWTSVLGLGRGEANCALFE